MISWFFTSAIRGNAQKNFSFRALVMLTALVISLFSEIYLVAFDVTKAQINKNLLPNLSFIVGIIIQIMRIENFGESTDSHPDSNWRNLV